MDPINLCPAVPNKNYTAPEDVMFEQVWDPKVMSPPVGVGLNQRNPDELVQEFSGAVSHDKVCVGLDDGMGTITSSMLDSLG